MTRPETVFSTSKNTAPMKLTIAEIERAVCAKFKLTPEQIRRRTTYRYICRPRQIVMFLAREISGTPYPRLGRHFGQDHTTAIHAVRRIRKLVQTKPKVAEHVEACRALLPSVEAKLARYRNDADRLKRGEVSWPADSASP
jgi:chromosomal replication initiator protein